MKTRRPRNTERKTPLSPIDQATGRKSARADFDRNRDGLYGGLPKTRDNNAPGPAPSAPHPTPGRAPRRK
ncbi:MAG TPA: hypothetical protein VHC42_12580 [Rhizomicrobium sp.]|jgi:hypothetical protein|nr:hypothetical protein [Rhizomicrobium sp.]